MKNSDVKVLLLSCLAKLLVYIGIAGIIYTAYTKEFTMKEFFIANVLILWAFFILFDKEK